MLEEVFPYFEYGSLVFALIFYKKYKEYPFYKFFLIYLINIVLINILSSTIFIKNNHELFNIYTFFEFNIFALIYYYLISDNKTIRLLKILALIFNALYIVSFFIIELEKLIVSIEAIFNSIFIILYFRELLTSDKVLNYRKLLPFWISVGFLIFYLTTIPFFTLLYFDYFNSIIKPYMLHFFIIVFHLCLIYGLVTCKKQED